jgi:hypothetical protein
MGGNVWHTDLQGLKGERRVREPYDLEARPLRAVAGGRLRCND